MGFMERIVFWIIPLVVMVIIIIAFFADDSFFAEVKDFTLGLGENLPEVSLGVEELSAEDVAIVESQRQPIMDMVNVMSSMLNKENQNCFMQYTPLPELGKDGTIISFVNNAIILKTKGGLQEDVQLTNQLSAKLNGFKPCVIAGVDGENKAVADIFYNNFLIDPSKIKEIEEQIILELRKQGVLETNIQKEKNVILKARLGQNYFHPLSNFEIKFDSPLLNYNENRIFFENYVSDLENNGWLFTPDGEHICFLPTFDAGGKSNKNGLNDDVFNDQVNYFNTHKCK